jgi:hypothetical protein
MQSIVLNTHEEETMAQTITYTGRNAKLRGKTFQVLKTKKNPRIKGVEDYLIKVGDASQWVSGRSVAAKAAKKPKAKAEAKEAEKRVA